MDSFRDDGNVIHIIGGDDKPFSATGNEYDKVFGGTTSNLSYGGNAIAANKSIAIQKLLFKTKWCVRFRSGTCQNATNCNFAHSSSELRTSDSNACSLYSQYFLRSLSILRSMRSSGSIEPSSGA
ncbi:zinc finger (CCCH-type) family protein [Artemisia annua]|uniref:Zinc finger (CCCH-type) family protein n=1 Tax=Artemisia annua TaxID=35608 RepID=A0A2U1LXU4_ARTAN|nr:zinc finger (CCCH-type) family protein [Artemisia annua]